MKLKCLLILPLLVASLQAASVSDLTFSLINGGTEYCVSDCDESASGSLDIASVYNGLPVTLIVSNAFSYCSNLTSITFPGSVSGIQNYAFRNCTNLTSITFEGNAPTFGTQSGLFFDSKSLTIYYYPYYSGWVSTIRDRPAVQIEEPDSDYNNVPVVNVVGWGDIDIFPPSRLPSNGLEVVSNPSANAALLYDGSVVTWGSDTGSSYNAGSGGDSSSVASQLTSGVTEIFSTNYAFAALKDDGSVITWGGSYSLGDFSSVSSRLASGVTKIFPLRSGFVALKFDGSFVTWGSEFLNSISPTSISSELSSGVSEIFSNTYAFAALLYDGSVVTRGDSRYGGDSSSVASQLTSGVSKISSTGTSFTALKEDGSVVTWGKSSYGGDSSSVQSQLRDVTEISSTSSAFAALKGNGSVVTWGGSLSGGDSSSVASQLTSGVTEIFSNTMAFAALKEDGSVVTWGGHLHETIMDGRFGGNSSSVAWQLSSGVTEIFSTSSAFAALKDDGSVVTWGMSDDGGDSSSVASELTSGVSTIYSNGKAFAALKEDGSVVTWGGHSSEFNTDGRYGGDSSSASFELSSFINEIYPTSNGFTALTSPRVIPALENLKNFYESDLNENIFIDVTPETEYSYEPTDYSYQWYYNDYAIPPLFGGTNSSYTISGGESSSGTWRVEITYPFGTASAEFEYRVFTDADGDGLSDYRESNLLDTDPSRSDTDNDGLNDGDEIITYLTNPLSSDTDGDGLVDGAEIITYGTDPFLNADFDSDGLSDAVEILTHNTDPKDTDSDDDQLSDAAEVNTHLTDPNLSDSDSDQLLDYAEIYTHLTDPNDSDSDNDGLNDYLEIITYLSDPNDPDSDDDGLSDGTEINTYSSNPNDSDTDDDGLGDGAEVNNYTTNPIVEDTTGDGFTDGFLVTQGFDPVINYGALRTETVDITDALNESRLLGQQDVTNDPSAYELFSESQLIDLKPSSTLIEVSNNEATIELEMHQSNDLQTWSKVGESISMTVPADSSTMFFRHAFSSSNSTDDTDGTDPTNDTTLEFTFIGTNNHDFGAYYGNEAIISTANIPLHETDSNIYYTASYEVIEWYSNTPIGGSQYGRPTVTVATTSSLVGHNLKIRFFKYDPNSPNNFNSSGDIFTIDGDALSLQEQTAVDTSWIGVSSKLGFSVRVWKEAKP